MDLKKALESRDDSRMNFVDHSMDFRFTQPSFKKAVTHKYLRREGGPGNYRYIYEDEKGREYSPTDKNKPNDRNDVNSEEYKEAINRIRHHVEQSLGHNEIRMRIGDRARTKGDAELYQHHKKTSELHRQKATEEMEKIGISDAEERKIIREAKKKVEKKDTAHVSKEYTPHESEKKTEKTEDKKTDQESGKNYEQATRVVQGIKDITDDIDLYINHFEEESGVEKENVDALKDLLSDFRSFQGNDKEFKISEGKPYEQAKVIASQIKKETLNIRDAVNDLEDEHGLSDENLQSLIALKRKVKELLINE